MLPFRSLFVLVLALLAGGVAHAAPPAVDDPEASLVSELVVTARTPGPAWWTVERGAAKLYIFGLPAGPVPKDLAWDQQVFQRRLKAATAFLPPPSVSFSVEMGLLQGAGFAARMAPGMGWTNGDVEKAMPPALAARFAADRTALGYPSSRYGTPAPILAAFKLHQDYLDKWGLSDETGARLIRAARKAGTPVEARLHLSAPPLKLADVGLERAPISDCFNAVLAETETDPERFRLAARGWAEGRLPEALSAPRDALNLCANRVYTGAFTHDMIAKTVEDLARRLQKPGVTVAVLGLRTLLAEDGVIAGLRAKGLTVQGPDAPDGDRRLP